MSRFDENCSAPECKKKALFWCDWKMPAGDYGLCNRPICEDHTFKVGEMKFLCPEHQKAYQAWQQRHQREPGEEG